MRMPIYTRKGDQGQTSTVSRSQITKGDLLIETIGTLDELNSAIGLCRSFLKTVPANQEIDRILISVQKTIFSINSELAGAGTTVEASMITNAEKIIDHYQNQLPLLKNFVIPGTSAGASACHIARTVCRRSERKLSQLNRQQKVNLHILGFINRLSDLLFVLARKIGQNENAPENIWSGN